MFCWLQKARSSMIACTASLNGFDTEVGKRIQKALRIGNERHALLAAESKQLHDCLLHDCLYR
jgi:hypothetical protein